MKRAVLIRERVFSPYMVQKISEKLPTVCYKGTETNPYDATRSGPLCPQMGLDQELFDHYLVNTNDQYCLDC